MQQDHGEQAVKVEKDLARYTSTQVLRYTSTQVGSKVLKCLGTQVLRYICWIPYPLQVAGVDKDLSFYQEVEEVFLVYLQASQVLHSPCYLRLDDQNQ